MARITGESLGEGPERQRPAATLGAPIDPEERRGDDPDRAHRRRQRRLHARFWALVLMQSGDKRPITSALANLQGVFFTDNNLIAAGSLLAAIPTVVVFFALQRHFVKGLTLGAEKG